MTKLTRLCSAPNGIVFLYDPEMIIDVPPDTGEGPILTTDNCVSIWTIHEDDGQVELTLSNENVPDKGDILFSGKLKIESGRIAFNDSGVNELIGMPTRTGPVRIRIYADDALYPEKVLCILDDQ